MPRYDLILFLDLETTGNTDYDEIVEVGLVLTDPTFLVLGDYSRVIGPSPDGMNRILANPTVRSMHETSGLLEELRGMPGSDWVNTTLDEVDDEICEWLDGLSGRSTEHIPLAGSGVMHFDRKYIRRDFPRFDKRLTYWAYDSGVLRRTWSLAGLPIADRPKSLVAHRALDDAYASVAEYQEYTKQLRRLV